MTRRALVLDFGGVISKTLFETHDLSERALNLAAGTLTWRGPFDVETDPLWRDMQAGTITERDYWTRRARETGRLVGRDWDTLPPFLTAVRGNDPSEVIRPEALEAIGAAKRAGHRLAILSNELDLFYGKEFRAKLPFLAGFDLIVDATYTEILKPDPRAFAFITDGLSIDAGDCVFVDDQLKNIRGGEAIGMSCVHFDVTRPSASYERALSLLSA
ncbi:HAD-IA family hydrolase [Rhizobium leguminosarum]|jgi:putative hydrolase of the HAD superfamily|uniref:HAD-IA family hydrolase n=1 Tax=Rhizobium leguminosarum TaxID=384 RepID=UPI001C94A69D|nr:HAD-IA family hydrolase [Rhizobium leguminosarum]MBY5371060.1 HAD-IA family hydrolase [Rhizobium leguminosarum]MBY5447213.1 HAD-IA family hydrolase [Rhizobium leguminosarum]